MVNKELASKNDMIFHLLHSDWLIIIKTVLPKLGDGDPERVSTHRNYCRG